MMYTQEIAAVNLSNIPIIYRLCRMARIMETVNNEVTWRCENSKVSPGFLIETLVISTLSNRKPLWKMHEFWSQEDLDFYYPELNLQIEWLNDDAYGRALDKLGQSNMKSLISKISIEMLKLHGLEVERLHVDTTSKSVQGVYTKEASGEFDITYGYSKDKRPDLKQYKIGAAVQQNGLVVMGEILPGNKSDNQWNPDAIVHMQNFFEGHQFKNVTFIGDSATVSSYDSLKQLKGIRFISRLPETFSIAEKLKEEAFKDNDFEDVGKLSSKENSARYRITSYQRELDGESYRFLVVHSTALESKKADTQRRNLQKLETSLNKKSQKLLKQGFACEIDAIDALENFKKQVEAENFLCQCEVIKQSKTTYGKQGRPKNSDSAEIKETYHAHCTIIGPDKEANDKKLQEDSAFILISSIINKEEMADVELLMEYKHQNSIEEAFRFIKSPVYLGQTLLNRKERVEAMGYVFILVLMLACYLQYRVRKSLEEKDEYVVDPGNKKNKRPSVKRIFEILENVVIIITSQGRFFATNTNPRIYKMIEWAGFDTNIYLKN